MAALDFKAKLVRLQSQAVKHLPLKEKPRGKREAGSWFRGPDLERAGDLPKVSWLSWPMMLSDNEVHCPIDKHSHSLHSDFHMHQIIQVIFKSYYITCTSLTTMNLVATSITDQKNGEECHSDFNNIMKVEILKNNSIFGSTIFIKTNY